MSQKLNISEVLSKVPLFSGLKENWEAFGILEKMMTVKDVPSGEMIIREGDTGDEFYILIQGQVSISKKTPDGDSYKVVILKSDIHPGMGEAGLIDKDTRTATIACDVHCQFLVLTRDQFADFCLKYPEYATPILQKISVMLMGRLKQTSNDLMLLHKALMGEIRGL